RNTETSENLVAVAIDNRRSSRRYRLIANMPIFDIAHFLDIGSLAFHGLRQARGPQIRRLGKMRIDIDDLEIPGEVCGAPEIDSWLDRAARLECSAQPSTRFAGVDNFAKSKFRFFFGHDYSPVSHVERLAVPLIHRRLIYRTTFHQFLPQPAPHQL